MVNSFMNGKTERRNWQISETHPVLDFEKFCQPGIDKQAITIASLIILALPAMGAQALAVLPANGFHGQGKQYLLPNDVIDFNKIPGKKSDLSIFFLQGNLAH